MPKPLKSYYKDNPGALEEFKKSMKKGREQQQIWNKYGKNIFWLMPGLMLMPVQWMDMEHFLHN
ncbi:MAG: hypothetical protein ACP5DQ_08865 [Bacteroidales bacterium]